MKLCNLVEYFRCGGDFEEFCAIQGLDSKSEVIEIYGTKPFHLDMDLAFFPIEETEGALQYTHDGRDYHNVFDFYYFMDAVKESNNEKNRYLSNEQIAEKLLAYAENDA